MNGFRPNSKDKKERKLTFAFARGYHRGVREERERIITDLLRDSLIITNVDVKILERVVEIVEG
ncbi:hypothetical protein UFOVP692_35 [uncultured Caudovirales phage]|jgi:hypothetical protein|uniref:Uncharacterized protein n=1 Tax=uncultured Caudovirales phage TaxID=2100421 RepID=A0A6J5NJM2_9CAUD|nr:hypothetical protein UFOVP692_35 [uncultured Caudovirales phage]